MASRPNILWICTDSQRWDTLGCYGNPLVHTPHLDALAESGVVFEQKLVVMHGQQPGELYDLAQDPGETHNLWNSPEYQETKLALLQRLCDRMAWTADPLPLRTACW